MSKTVAPLKESADVEARAWYCVPSGLPLEVHATVTESTATKRMSGVAVLGRAAQV